ncbi:MAG: EAL domain-containing protein [Oscillospiraceae bacterium]|nr:EAL domain-containing protein [Oscillospiraceae bacterium]
MLKSHEKFHSANGKRQILIADDEMINREILGEILKTDYEVLFASDGRETMDMIRTHSATLSLVLLDIMMPVMTGLEILKAIKADAELSRIPVIVMTSEKDTEVESLLLGATDFIPKPYPDVNVIHARVLRTIELFEDRDIIQSTERDSLTGLYNREYFFRYAEQYDQFHPDVETDAVIVDINHFRMINERYGKAYGDEVLRRIALQLRESIGASGGIVSRLEADTFMAYCPHRSDYEAILDGASASLTEEDASENRVRLRMGIYPCTDKQIDMERRVDRAKMAADTTKNSFSKSIGFYDNNLHERELYAEKLIEDFSTAIREKQFKVFYQPKFDVRPDTPLLSSAEALVRWVHPELGMISPGVFIPLFEENGLIQRLDTYVWEEAARQIRDWKDRLGYAVPVSVNVSRIDMYDPRLPETLLEIIRAHGLTGRDFLLEVTESAYTQDSMQIISTVETLRKNGFQIEMDDFGTGYSSLNMISNLPIDALKLDMQFIRDAFKEGGSTHMLEVIIGISDYLSVPVIAEGVETEEQLHVLKSLGCDIVQGYFFSKPVPAEKFEPFILQKKEADLAAGASSGGEAELDSVADQIARSAKLDLLRDKAEVKEEPLPLQAEEPAVKEHTGIQLKTASLFFVILAFLAAIALLVSDIAVSQGYQRMESASDRYIASQMAASDMESGSDYLTDRVRCFVVTGEIDYLNDFIEEVEQTRRRDRAVERLAVLLDENDNSAINSLNAALSLSNELVEVENRAMRLMLQAEHHDLAGIPADIAGIPLTDSERAMSDEELKDRAQSLVFNNNYMHYKDRIRENVNLCTQALIRSASQELEAASTSLSLLVRIQTAMTIIFFLITLGIVTIITMMVRRPLTKMVLKMQEQEEITPTGVEELRFVTRIYNRILQENRSVREKLSHEASHDALTGLFNRGAYDLLMESTDKRHMALILIDVDYFKTVNDTYGHAVGDRVLKRVADLMRASFRSVDILCRTGGDEFVVVMTRVNSSMSQLVRSKIGRMNDLLQHPKDDLPPVSLSVGVAFSDRENPQGDIFRDADAALYEVKKAGRRGCRIFGEG